MIFFQQPKERSKPDMTASNCMQPIPTFFLHFFQTLPTDVTMNMAVI